MSDPRRWKMLPVILIATFMGLFDFFVVNVSAPSFQYDLGADESQIELIVGGYAFCYAAGLITGGRLGDLFTYRRVFIAGMAAFTMASALCGVAQNPSQLVAFRFLQGLTAAIMAPQVLAMITAVFPPAERGRAVSWFTVSMAAGSVAGQVLGGVILDADVLGLGWRAIFLVNVPVGLVAVPLALLLLPSVRANGRPRFDVLGAAGLAVALGLALAPLVVGRGEGWPAWCFVLLAASVPALALVVAFERRLKRRGGQPIVDLDLFGQRGFVTGLAINLLVMAFYSSFMLSITLYLQLGLGLTPLYAGLTFGPMGLAFGAMSIRGPALVMRYGARVIAAGGLVSGAGLALQILLLRIADVTAALLLPGMILVGLGTGLMFPGLVATVLVRVKPYQAGSAAGVLTTVQQFAIAVGVAALGTLFFSVLGSAPDRTGFDDALTAVSLVTLIMVLAVSALSRLLVSRKVPAVTPVAPEPEPAP